MQIKSLDEVINRLQYKADNIKAKLEPSYFTECIEYLKSLPKCDNGWIPCSERLPEEKENPITRDYYVYPVMVDLGKRSDIRYYGYGDGHWWHGLTKMDGLVTHWMDIKPYQPKGE